MLNMKNIKKFWRWLLIALGFVVIRSTSCTKEEYPLVYYSDIEFNVFEQINKYRISLGLTMCKQNNHISEIAKTHSQFMIDGAKVSHDNFAKRADILMCKIDAKSVGEVVGFGYATAEGVVKGWIKSESHNQIITGKSWTDFGVSAIQNEKGRYYFTLIFTRQ